MMIIIREVGFGVVRVMFMSQDGGSGPGCVFVHH